MLKSLILIATFIVCAQSGVIHRVNETERFPTIAAQLLAEDYDTELNKTVVPALSKDSNARVLKIAGGHGSSHFSTEAVESRSRAIGDKTIDDEISALCGGGVNSTIEQGGKFKYYIPCPENETMYIECDPWGVGRMRHCPEGKIWDEWAVKCDTPLNVQNGTRAMLNLEKAINSIIPQFNCITENDHKCVNGGKCVTVNKQFKCQCAGKWTGEVCDVPVEFSNVYTDIVTGKFSLPVYRQKLAVEFANFNDDKSYYEQYESTLDKATYDELIRYVALYKNGEVRYDRVINGLVDDVLQNIYPDSFFLTSMNASNERIVDVLQFIPNLLSYAKYSSERYEQVFVQYMRVLGLLKPELVKSWPTIRVEATAYAKLTSLYVNQTMAIQNETIAKMGLSSTNGQLSEAQVKDKMRVEYNQTLDFSEELYEVLTDFQTQFTTKVQEHPEWANKTLSQCTSKNAVDTLRLLNEVVISNQAIWDALVNYGFWFITNAFVLTQ